jgi:hypothetical protein
MASRTFNMPPLLMKIGQRNHLQSLKDKGEVYFGTYEGYRQQETAELLRIKEKIRSQQPITPADFDLVWRDSLEGVDKTLLGKANLKIKHEGQTIEMNGIDAKLNLFQNDYTHLYCMFGFAPLISSDFHFDNRLSYFGDHILIFDSKLFLTALANTFKTKFDFNYVSYYEENVLDAKLGPFAKRSAYSYQYEYRVAANLDNNFVYIGDVLATHENTHLLKFEDLNKIELDIGL